MTTCLTDSVLQNVRSNSLRKAEEDPDATAPAHDLSTCAAVLGSPALLSANFTNDEVPKKLEAEAAARKKEGGRRGYRDVVAAEVRRLKETEGKFQIPRAAFQRLVSDVCKDLAQRSGEDEPMKIGETALCALQLGLESSAERLFEDAALLCNHAKRTTVCLPDLEAALVLRARAGDPLASDGLKQLQTSLLEVKAKPSLADSSKPRSGERLDDRAVWKAGCSSTQ